MKLTITSSNEPIPSLAMTPPQGTRRTARPAPCPAADDRTGSSAAGSGAGTAAGSDQGGPRSPSRLACQCADQGWLASVVILAATLVSEELTGVLAKITDEE